MTEFHPAQAAANPVLSPALASALRPHAPSAADASSSPPHHDGSAQPDHGAQRPPRNANNGGRRGQPARAGGRRERGNEDGHRADAGEGRSAGGPRRAAPTRPRHPVLVQLAELYPQLFGETAVPVKRGIFQDLMAAHPEVFARDALKDALGQHTRATPYLTAVALGQQRHDLQGQAVEAMAPEHVYHALLEVFRRRHARTGEDLRAKLVQRMVRAFQASDLSAEAYAELVHSRDEAANALLQEALSEATAQVAKDEALSRTFEASGQNVQDFSDAYGLYVRDVENALKRNAARQAAAAKAEEATAAAHTAAVAVESQPTADVDTPVDTETTPVAPTNAE